MSKSAVIIGGGIGGLFTGALLAKNGIKVTVLEKNVIIGGGLQCFGRKGKTFETGMHVMGGFGPGGSLNRICRYLGILDKLDIHYMPAECMDEIIYRSSGKHYRIPSGRQAFVDYFCGLFPAEAQGIKDYVDEIYRLSEEVPLFHLREAGEGIAMHSEKFIWAADKLINHFVSDSELREVLAYLNPLYGGIPDHTPAYIHALINVLYINGSSRFVGGSQQLAEALRTVIEEASGSVVNNCQVVGAEVADRHIQALTAADGTKYTADWYISAIHPAALLKIVPDGTFLRGYVNRLQSIPLSYSAFTLFVDLKPGMFPYIDHTCYYMEDYGRMWTQQDVDADRWPCGFMYMTPPDPDQGEYANRLLVHCVMDYADVAKWADTTVGHRGDEYEAWKAERTNRIIGKLESLYPGFSSAVANVYSASPLTIRDYYATPEGAIFGYRKDCQNFMLSQIPVYTKVNNLLLTGQNINLHGICGVPLTAINTAEAILGVNKLVRDINKANENI